MASDPSEPRSTRSLMRLALEVEGWLDLGAADRALGLLGPLLDHPLMRGEGQALRCRALVELGRFAEALLTLDEVALLRHDVEWLAVTRAWCHKRLGDLPAAILRMEELLDAHHDSAIGHYNLGCYLTLAGDTERAIAELAIAFDLDASFRQHARDESDLDELRGDARFDALCGDD